MIGAWWIWGLVGAVVGVIVLMIVFLLVLRASHSKVQMIPLASADPAQVAAAQASAPKSHVSGSGLIALHRSFRQGLRMHRSLTPRVTIRTATPWILSLGETGVGKSTILQSLGLSRLDESTHGHLGVGEPPCVWHFFERGIVLDVSGALMLDRDAGHTDDRTWKALIGLLNRHRPERPADAIVLSISSADLVGPQKLTDDVIAAKAARLEAKLSELQKSIALRLPIYVVITKCDRIPGFTSFARSLPPERRQQMLGWSSPYAMETAFAPTQVDEALGVIVRGVQDAEFAAFATGEESDPDEMVLLPPRIMAMRPAMRAFFERLFRQTSYEHGPALRGIYLTGDAERAAPVAETFVAPLVAADEFAPVIVPAPAAAKAAAAPRRAFLNDLFNDKIFAERGLAHAGPKVFPSRNKRIAALQMGTAAILLFGPLGLYWAGTGTHIGAYRLSNGVTADMSGLLPLLKTISVADTEMAQAENDSGEGGAAGDGGRRANIKVFPLLNSMAGVSTAHFGSIFLPTSFVSPLHRQVETAIRLSFEDVILPQFASSLKDKMRTVLSEQAVNGGVAPVPHERGAESLPQYLTDLRVLAEQIQRYNRMAGSGGGTTQDLAAMVEYLYNEEVSASFFENDDYYRAALQQATADPLTPSGRDQARALQRAGLLVEDSYTAVSSRLTGPRISGAPEAGLLARRADVQAVVGLRAFLDTAGPVEHALSQIGPPFVFGDKLSAEVRDSLVAYRDRLTGEIATRFGSKATPTEGTLRALDALLRQRFMQAATGRVVGGSIPAGTEPRFDLARLDEAIALHDNFSAFLAHGLDSLPDGLRGAVRRLAAVQVGAAMANAIAEAVAISPVLAGAKQESVRELHTRVGTFEEAASRVSRLLDLLDDVGATMELDSLETLMTHHAAATLARVDTVIDVDGRYLISPSALQSWNGQAPFTGVALGAKEMTFGDFLASEEDAMRTAAPLARPLVVFLQAHVPPDQRTAAAVRSWTEVLDALDRADRKPATGPLAMLDKRLAADLDSIDVKTCLRRPVRTYPGGDVISRRIDDLQKAVWRRCAEIAGGSVRVTYSKLESEFTQRLAGKFPFSANASADDASPADVVAFLRDYDILGPNSPDVISASGNNASRVQTFLAEAEAVRKFLAPLVDSAARPLTYDYLVDFRVNRTQEVAANQIADWTTDIGAQHAAIGGADAARRGRWRAGDTVKVSLRWATGSPVVPVQVSGPSSSVSDGVARVAFGGPWAMLRLMRAYEADPVDGDGGPGTIGIVTKTAKRPTPGDASMSARAFIRIRLYSPDNKAELKLPHFPVSASSLPAGGSR